jgi:hypothetical protein
MERIGIKMTGYLLGTLKNKNARGFVAYNLNQASGLPLQ